eukprot:IDg19523t1
MRSDNSPSCLLITGVAGRAPRGSNSRSRTGCRGAAGAITRRARGREPTIQLPTAAGGGDNGAVKG